MSDAFYWPKKNNQHWTRRTLHWFGARGKSAAAGFWEGIWTYLGGFPIFVLTMLIVNRVGIPEEMGLGYWTSKQTVGIAILLFIARR